MRRSTPLSHLRWTLWGVALLLGACVATTPRPAPAPLPPTAAAPAAAAPAAATAPAVLGAPPVTAVLFGYIPDAAHDDFKSLIVHLTDIFMVYNPRLTAQITIDPNLDLYDLQPGGELETLLGNGPRSVNVVELDMLLLGELVKRHWVQPLPIQISGILPEAARAASVNNQSYGFPTYLCSNVIYAHDSGITGVGDGPTLLKFLTSLGHATPLVGNYSGSWTLPSVYLDGWADTHGAGGLATAYLPPVDPSTMSSFGPLVQSCASGTTNPCLDGTYASGTAAETAFATGQANGFVGFTERLFYILSAATQPQPSVISAPLGLGTHPIMFVDALVVNSNCTGSCFTNALKFITSMSSVNTRNLIAFSEDAQPGTFPRYLLQANANFYVGSQAKQDPFYPQFWNFIQNAVAFPNQGFPEDRLLLGPEVMKALGSYGPVPPGR
jgi:thiamine pyridinylase